MPAPKPRKPNKRFAFTPESKEEGIRLNKYISNAGICSRREADDLIKMGMVQVNGQVVTQMGFKVQPKDEVRYDGQRLNPQKQVYVLLNKPKGFVATSQGGKIKRSVQELIQTAAPFAVPPLGDMGRPVTGLLLFTNDQDLRKKISQSAKGLRMLYHVVLDKSYQLASEEKLLREQTVFDRNIKLNQIKPIQGGKKNEIGVEAYQVSPSMLIKLFENNGYTIQNLDRVMLGGLTKKDLPRGRWRTLTDKEVNFLRML